MPQSFKAEIKDSQGVLVCLNTSKNLQTKKFPNLLDYLKSEKNTHFDMLLLGGGAEGGGGDSVTIYENRALNPAINTGFYL